MNNNSKKESLDSKKRKLKNRVAIKQKLMLLLLTSLLKNAGAVANTASVYGAYLKHLKNPLKKN